MIEVHRGCELQVRFRSDWRVGTGTRTPALDSLVARDTDGLPCVPATTLTGILRDSCELAVRALDQGLAGPVWAPWLDYLLGEQPGEIRRTEGGPPRPAALRIGQARFSEAIRRRLPSDGWSDDAELIRAAFTFPKSGVKIDRRTGRAQDDFLRFEEVCRGGAVLTSAVGFPAGLAGEDRRVALALMAAGARLADRLGGDRRRGLGRCEIRVLDGGMAVDAGAALRAAPEIPSRPPELAPGPRASEAAATGTWIERELRIVLLDPLVAAAAVSGNVTESLEHVPGAMLLGWFSGEAARLGVDSTPWIRDGHVRVLPAIPDVDGRRPVPVPLAFHRLKDRDEVVNRLKLERLPGEQALQLRGGYLSAADAPNGARLGKVLRSSHTMNSVRDDLQRPTASTGGLYTYQAIPPGTVLRSRLAMDAGLARLLPGGPEALSGEARLGRSRKNFGLVSVQVMPAPPAARPQPATRRVTVLLETDLLLRGPGGGWSTSVDDLVTELSHRAGSLTLVESYVRCRRHDGFQAAWGLPRPSLVVFAAGTCLVVETAGDADLAALDQGVGERLAEGFGRLRLDDPLLEFERGRLQEVRLEPDAAVPDGAPAALADADREFAEAVERAAWRERIRRSAETLAAGEAARKAVLGFTADAPAPSQVGGLRGALLGIERFESAGAVRAWLASLESAGKRQFQRVAALLNDRQEIWKQLEQHERMPAPLLTGRDVEALRDELWGEAVRALVAAAARARSLGVDVPPPVVVGSANAGS